MKSNEAVLVGAMNEAVQREQRNLNELRKGRVQTEETISCERADSDAVEVIPLTKRATSPHKSRRRGTGSLYKRPGCDTWTIKFYRGGRPIREATGLTDYQAARQKLNQRLHQVSTGTFAGLSMERICVSELAEDFLRDYRINDRKSYDHAERRWRKHLSPFFGPVRVANVTSSEIARYVDRRMEEGAKPGTINRELAALKRMFRLGYYASPPKVFRLPAFPHLQENNVRTGFVDDGEYARLTSAATELWMRAIIELAHTYGWRKAELLFKLRAGQVDLKSSTIRLDPGTTKNRDGREVTMTPPIAQLLAECISRKKSDDFVFTRSDGKPVHEFRQAWRNLCCAAGLGQMLCRTCETAVNSDSKCPTCSREWKRKDLKYGGMIFHDLRRSAARNFRRAGVAEGVIMRIGGWRTRSVFERYNIVSQVDIKDALTKLERQRSADQEQGVTSEFGHNFGHNRADLSPAKNERENAKVH